MEAEAASRAFPRRGSSKTVLAGLPDPTDYTKSMA